MALRSVIRPFGLTHTPSRITPRLLRCSYSAATTPNNKPAADLNKKTDPETEASATSTTTAPNSTENAVVKTEAGTTEEKSETETKKKEEEIEHGYAFGAYHWNMERASAITLIPLMSTQMIYGAHPVVDGLLGVVLPYHIYMGFDSCITDYIPKRVYPRLHKAANWTLSGATGLVMWGCYEFNTNDIGITEFIQRAFAA